MQQRSAWADSSDGRPLLPTAPPGTAPAGWHPNPGGGSLADGCCFNYWSEDATAPHGVANLSVATPLDDSLFLADAFERFIESRNGAPFLAQISFHNCA